ncbi:hypothetical protein NDU88_003653 [Pleurodeles waltl]|uniref:Uncharacterized protein n=1 Tax=Pleurodeles waltl TaxID=8319 RepID=A0AAV7PBT8_PLEWA|nr:hypothetical protein NDU88_003653 [Pleurodeles waltl]
MTGEDRPVLAQSSPGHILRASRGGRISLCLPRRGKPEGESRSPGNAETLELEALGPVESCVPRGGVSLCLPRRGKPEGESRSPGNAKTQELEALGPVESRIPWGARLFMPAKKRKAGRGVPFPWQR